MKKKVNHRTLHLVLVGIIILGFILFALANIVINVTGNPILKQTDEIRKLNNDFEATGFLETLVVDNFEKGNSEYRYYLHDGKQTQEISFADKSVNIGRNEINIKGTKINNKIEVSSIEEVVGIKADILEPFPPVMGDQKYLVVFLFKDDIQTFDIQNYTNISFYYANQYIKEVSYGKASLSYGDIYSFDFPDSLCQTWEINNYVMEKVSQYLDPFIYAGIVIYHPTTNCTHYSGMATLGKFQGFYKIYINYISVNNPFNYQTFAHEIDHNFGIGHASRLVCGTESNEITLGGICSSVEYGNDYDIMGHSSFHKNYGARAKLVSTQWIDESSVPEVESGVYQIGPINTPPTAGEIKGLKIPIKWDISRLYVGGHSQFIKKQLDHYYIEYRTPYGTEGETFPMNGVLIYLGRDSMSYPEGDPYEDIFYLFTNTFLLNVHPNNSSRNISETWAYPYGYIYLEKGQNYIDRLNMMKISVLDADDDKATVEVKECIDSDNGKDYYTRGNVNGIGDVCQPQHNNNVIEKYCDTNIEVATSVYSCPNGCSDGKCISIQTSGCQDYYDKKLGKWVRCADK